MIITTEKTTMFEFNFDKQEIDAMEKVAKIFKTMHIDLANEEDDTDFIYNADGEEFCINTGVFSEAWETLEYLISYRKWKT